MGEFFPSHSEYYMALPWWMPCGQGKIVDLNFRVIGIDASRVVDGSIFTVSPGKSPGDSFYAWGVSAYCYLNALVLQD